MRIDPLGIWSILISELYCGHGRLSYNAYQRCKECSDYGSRRSDNLEHLGLCPRYLISGSTEHQSPGFRQLSVLADSILPGKRVGGGSFLRAKVSTLSDVYRGSFQSLRARHLVCVGLRSTLGSVSAKIQANYQGIALCIVQSFLDLNKKPSFIEA